ncbi:MAG: hypothetical protein N3F09_10070 [Bacteroidia bacterium]|nr:hypothetical protein [Bacteroidia bacterium]
MIVTPKDTSDWFKVRFKNKEILFLIYDENHQIILHKNSNQAKTFQTDKISGLKSLAEFLTETRFGYVIMVIDKNFKNYLTFFNGIQANHIICIQRPEMSVQLNKKCFAVLNLSENKENHFSETEYFLGEYLKI